MKIDGKIQDNKNFSFYFDKKITTWRRHYFKIDALTKEDAIEKVEKIFRQAINMNNYDPDEIDFYESEEFYGMEEFLHPEDNHGSATMELYDSETGEELINNRI